MPYFALHCFAAHYIVQYCTLLQTLFSDTLSCFVKLIIFHSPLSRPRWGSCHANASLPRRPARRRDKREASERLWRLDGRWCTAGSATCLSGSLYFEAAAPETSRPRSNKQRAGKYADVCSRTWVGFLSSSSGVGLPPCGSASCGSASCSRRDAFAVPSTRTSPSAVHVAAVRPALAGPGRAVRGWSGFCFFLERPEGFLRSCFSGRVLLGTPQLDSRKFGILETGEITSTPPAVCFFLSLSEENVIFTVRRTHSPPGHEKTCFYSSPARNMKHVTSCVVVAFFSISPARIFIYFFLPDPRDGK